jgi:predicted RNase H-like nuclease (RuvC/YqgF family)
MFGNKKKEAKEIVALKKQIKALEDEILEHKDDYNTLLLENRDTEREMEFVKSEEFTKQEANRITSDYINRLETKDRKISKLESDLEIKECEVIFITEKADAAGTLADDITKKMVDAADNEGYARGYADGVKSMQASVDKMLSVVENVKSLDPATNKTVVVNPSRTTEV